MGRASTKENKNVYQQRREELGLTREAASELLEGLSQEKIERIENERTLPQPDEVLIMAEGYKEPELCNYYCSNECPSGRKYVPEVKIRDLAQIILEMLASLNTVQKKQEQLIEIAADGAIDRNEIPDFVQIQEDLEKISITVETLQLWSEKMLANGSIDRDAYEAYMSERGQSSNALTGLSL